MYKFIVTVFLLLSSVVNAGDIPRNTKNIIGIFNNDTNNPINTRDVYGDVINYYLPENINTITIHTSTYGSVSIDLNLELEQVISEWREAGLQFNRMVSNQGMTRHIGYRIGNDGSAYGYTNFNEPRENDAVTRVSIDTNALSRLSPRYYERLIAENRISRDMPFPEFIRMVVRVTLLHETGHALGLAHNNENGSVFPGGHRIGREIIRCGIVTARPSIMVSGAPISSHEHGSYLDLLSRYLSRNITINDVALSRNDLDGANRMFTSHSPRGAVSLFCLAVFMSVRGSEL
ncbi:hypothetical protein [Vibrio hyugaensis]|uniref:hypothetical protein n=1 Tax=Vibrio hyugaensis TaxID=1534743 RepID=UPI000CE3AD70|nr:hypothetical protein [Vibrio hyugaensis]